MAHKIQTQGTIQNFDLDFYISRQVELFLIDRRASGLAAGTLKFYTIKLKRFVEFCDSQMIVSILDIDASLIRSYMLKLEEENHNKGGQHAHYRALRAFLLWYEIEMEPDHWKNPIKKTRAPKVPQEILEPVSIETVNRLMDVCDKESVYGLRDIAIILMLYDTGLRASELLALNKKDIDRLGTVFVRHGKGGKDRIVFMGKKSRAALRKYLRIRTDKKEALFLSRYESRLSYDGLRAILTRRAEMANITAPNLHAFRRSFALNMIRSGTDIHTLAKLMGHSSIAVLSRYLKIEESDIRAAHKRGGPVDNNL